METVGKAEQKKALKQTALMNAAFELFTEQGFGKTSIAEIAQRAKVAKGTFYLYFKDKYDLRTILTIHKAEQVFSRAWAASEITEETPFEQIVTDISSNIIDILEKDRALTFFLVKNLNFGMFRRGETRPGRETIDFYGMTKRALDRSEKKYRTPEIMLSLIVELIGSTTYSAIIDHEPAPVREMKPHILSAVSAIMKLYEQ